MSLGSGPATASLLQCFDSLFALIHHTCCVDAFRRYGVPQAEKCCECLLPPVGYKHNQFSCTKSCLGLIFQLCFLLQTGWQNL